jgi:hypothetical protein
MRRVVRIVRAALVLCVASSCCDAGWKLDDFR